MGVLLSYNKGRFQIYENEVLMILFLDDGNDTICNEYE